MKQKAFLLLSALFVSGCAAVDVLLGGADGSPGVLEQAGDVLKDSDNPTFAVVGLTVTTVAAIINSIRERKKGQKVLTGVVDAVEKGFEELTPGQVDAMKTRLSEAMPNFVKEAVAKVKAKL